MPRASRGTGRDVLARESNKPVPGLPGVPVFSEKAVNALNELLLGQIELLPLKHATEKYLIINVVNVVDSVDYEN